MERIYNHKSSWEREVQESRESAESKQEGSVLESVEPVY